MLDGIKSYACSFGLDRFCPEKGVIDSYVTPYLPSRFGAALTVIGVLSAIALYKNKDATADKAGSDDVITSVDQNNQVEEKSKISMK